MDNVSKVIFTGLAIGYTFLIYQNIQLKDDIDDLRASIESESSLTMAEEIEECMELYLPLLPDSGYMKDDGEMVYWKTARNDAFRACSLNYRKQTID